MWFLSMRIASVLDDVSCFSVFVDANGAFETQRMHTTVLERQDVSSHAPFQMGCVHIVLECPNVFNTISVQVAV